MLVNNNSMGSYYEVGAHSSMNQKSSFLYNRQNPILGIPPSMLRSSKTALSPEAKAMAACKSHKEAERRRRKRINGHLSTLRGLLPNLIKTDKASVLGEVVRRVRELKRATSQLTAHHPTEGDNWKQCLVPGDNDEITLRRSENDSSIYIATLCCEDRPELIADLTRALRSVKGSKVVKAELATVGGRTKTVMWVRGVGGASEGLLRRALKAVVDRHCPASSSEMGRFGLRMCMY